MKTPPDAGNEGIVPSLGVFAAGAAVLTRREQWNEGFLPSSRAGSPRSQGGLEVLVPRGE